MLCLFFLLKYNHQEKHQVFPYNTSTYLSIAKKNEFLKILYKLIESSAKTLTVKFYRIKGNS